MQLRRLRNCGPWDAMKFLSDESKVLSGMDEKLCEHLIAVRHLLTGSMINGFKSIRARFSLSRCSLKLKAYYQQVWDQTYLAGGPGHC